MPELTKKDAIEVVIEGLLFARSTAGVDVDDYLEDSFPLLAEDERQLLTEDLLAEVEGMFQDLVELVKTWQI